MRQTSPMRASIALFLALSAVTEAAAATIAGRITASGSGAPIAGRNVSATRRASVPAGDPASPIPVEVNATTDANGNYVLTIPDGVPGAAEMLVYTRSTLHFNELFGGVDASAYVPTAGDAARPGVVLVNGTGSATGIDFALDSSRSDAWVTMRDGQTRLATTWWTPARSGSWPTIVVRTTYNKEGLTPGQPDFWIPAGYAIVVQDTRGRYASEGFWRPFRDDGWGANQDGYDTIEWVAAQPWSDGHVGTYGGSALGIVQYMAAGAAPPHLDAAWVVVGAPQAYHDMVFQGGGYRKELVDNWLDGQGGSYMKDEYAQHPHDDAYWAVQDLFTRLDVVRTPIYHVGGWYDIFDEGTVRAFSVLQEAASAGARWNQKLRMGPWTHGTLGLNVAGDATYPFNALDGDAQNADLLRWFDFWLKGKDTGILDEPPVRAYAMGPQGLQQTAVGNTWRTYPTWPPAATRRKYYLQRRGGLATSLPAANGGSDTFTYDPQAPVPTVGGPNLTIAAGPYDQTAVEGRSDVLTFTSDPLPSPLEIGGNVRARLYASSTATDTDWTVKLVDVYPEGTALSVTDGVLRARHRNGFDAEQLMTPGTVYAFDVDLWTTSLVFGAGHRIRIEVSSSNHPRFDPNPNTGHPFRADLQVQPATNTVWHDPTRASYLELPVVDAATVSGCATGATVAGLRVDRAAGDGVTLSWNPVGADPCFAEYRVFGSNDPSSWARFVRNPLARTTATSEVLDEPYTFYLVVAAGTNGANGPR